MEIEKISGEVQKILFESENGFCIALIKCENHFYDLTIKGTMKLTKGQTYLFEGSFKEDIKYGEFFQVNKYEREKINSGDEIINFLSSKNFEGVGKRTASKIYEEFGEETLQIIKKNPEKLREIGISESISHELNIKLQADDLMADLYELLIPFEYSDYMIQEIYQLLSILDITAKIHYLKYEPYDLINNISRFNFIKADEIFLHFNKDLSNEKRIYAGINHLIKEYCYETGNTKINIENLLIKAQKLLQVNTDEIKEVINNSLEEKTLFAIDDFLIEKEFYYAEIGISRNLTFRKSAIIHKVDEKLVNPKIASVEKKLKINYSEIQKEAIKCSLNTNVSIITGGPGTGKTTIVKAVVNIFSELKYDEKNIKDISEKIILCAPTGRAAQRLKEATGFEARTIHSLLGWDPYSHKFTKNIDNQLTQELIVIDEFSMVDIFLANSLFKAIRPNSIVIIIGDDAQLESVNPGNVLSDLLESKEVETIKLDKIYRQGEGSTIVKLAHQIEHNDKIELHKTNDMSVLDRNHNILEDIKLIIDKSYEKGYSESDLQILFPKYKGLVGINSINKKLVPEEKKDLEEVIYGEIKYQVGHKVMQLKNDYDKGVYNGDIGFITRMLNPYGKGNQLIFEVDFNGNKIELARNDLENLTHAYAISIHKSQGSEFPVIVLPITSDSQRMLSKKLLYTAITRAKEKLIIVGEIDSFLQGVEKLDESRNTNLSLFLQSDEINLKTEI